MEEIRRQRAVQALHQEKVVFERRRIREVALSRLEHVTGWFALAMLAVDAVAALVQPLLLIPLAPINGFAFWYYRRLLKSGPPEFQPITEGPPTDHPKTSREYGPSPPSE